LPTVFAYGFCLRFLPTVGWRGSYKTWAYNVLYFSFINFKALQFEPFSVRGIEFWQRIEFLGYSGDIQGSLVSLAAWRPGLRCVY
jgi:hypothetical protein